MMVKDRGVEITLTRLEARLLREALTLLKRRKKVETLGDLVEEHMHADVFEFVEGMLDILP